MGMLIGHAIVEGVPFINGKRAIPCDKDDKLVKMMGGSLAPWKCPECDAHLSGKDMICLNGCHMSSAAMRRFNQMLGNYSVPKSEPKGGRDGE